MAREVTTTGSKKLKTLYKQFNEHFPYLHLNLHASEMADKAKAGKTIYGLNIDKTLSDVREKTGSGKISFSGRKNVCTIEKEFDEIFGLYAQICYTTSEGKGHYTSGSNDKKSLSQLNRENEVAGCMKDIWK